LNEIRMTRPFALCLATLAFIFGTVARGEEADNTERSVLGGSPPIYASELQLPLAAADYKRHRAVSLEETLQPRSSLLGKRCATRVGLFGPGESRPVDTACIGRDPAGKLYRGRVVPDGMGTYCATASGLFGPGAEQSIGMPCTVNTKLGPILGRVRR
jgi:hypothetical protein